MTSRYLLSLVLIFVVATPASVSLAAEDGLADEVETLHGILNSRADLHAKGVACRRLAVIGNHDSIPILAGLLTDEELSHFARTGLEAIPGPAADEALRKSLHGLEGSRLIGVVNSIGNRRDTLAVVPLISLSKDASETVQAAVASALGRIASPEASAQLRKSLKATTGVPPAYLLDACLQCADNLFKEDRKQEAIVFYDVVRKSAAREHVRNAATFSALTARGEADLGLLAEQLRSKNDRSFAMALQASRQIAGRAVGDMLLGELGGATSQRKALLIGALTDRRFTPALPIVLRLISDDSRVVRMAAVMALEQLGDETALDRLLMVAASDDGPLSDAAMKSLAGLKGDRVNAAVLDKLNGIKPLYLKELVQLVGTRRIVDGVPHLWKASGMSSSAIRLAALESLGSTVQEDDLDRLVSQVLDIPVQERKAGVKALTSACRRAVDPDRHVSQIADQFSRASLELHTQMYDVLRSIGGPAALKHTISGAKDERDVIQDAATRVLGEWPTPDVAPELLGLATALDGEKYRIRAIRGYIRVIRQFGLPADKRLEMARQAMKVATRNQEKVLVLHALLRFRNVDSMKMSIEYLETPGLEPTAAQVAIYISDQITDAAEIRRVMQAIVNADVGETYTRQAQEILIRIGQ